MAKYVLESDLFVSANNFIARFMPFFRERFEWVMSKVFQLRTQLVL